MTSPPETPEVRVPVPDSTLPLASHEADLALVREVLGGSDEAWATFVVRYSGLIWAILRRYLFTRDPDDLRSIYVNILESLYRRKLATYEGRSSLSTWISLVTRTEVLDFLRTRFGRRQAPRGLERLSEYDRAVFRLYYVEGLELSEVARRLANGNGATPLKVIAGLRRIERRVEQRTLRRLAYDLHAQSTGAASGRLLAYLDHVRDEFEQNAGAYSPDYYLMEREARHVVDRVRREIERLAPEEQRVLTLRFERGWSARRIAEELGLESPRGAFTLLERVVRVLRRRLASKRRDR